MRRLRRIGLWVGGTVAGLFLLFGVSIRIPYPVTLLDPGRSEPIRVLCREGSLLRSVPAAGSERRAQWTTLSDISPHVVLAIITAEDRHFYDHVGVDGRALLRSFGLNLRHRGLRYGGSTLTMQLMRILHSPGQPRTLWRKLHEIWLALRIERQMDKSGILEQYLNRAAFANGVTGIEAASRQYFGKPAASLSLGEATALVVIPRGPALYNPLKHPERLLQRRNAILLRMVADGRISHAEMQRSLDQTVSFEWYPLAFDAPHFVEYVLSDLPRGILATASVHTTLDSRLQSALVHRTRQHVQTMAHMGMEQAGVVVLDARNGEVLAMVGSAGADTPGHHVNITTRRRYPGSALKPFVYATALEQGDSPATIVYDIYDVPSNYRVTGRPPPERGPVTYRQALAGSLNLAAVHVLERVGVSRVMEKLRTAKVAPLSLSAEEYGLRLALGSARVRMIDLAAGYGFVVRDGKVMSPTGIRFVRYTDGQEWRPQRIDQSVFSPQVSWLVMDMLSDPEARRAVFGDELAADLPYRIVAKTGTAGGFSDVFAIFATQSFIVAAWAGRFDGRPMNGVMGMDGAGPLARDALLTASAGRSMTLPVRPDGVSVRTVCSLSGKPASDLCPHRMNEYFMEYTATDNLCDWHILSEGRVSVRYPLEIQTWARRTAHR